MPVLMCQADPISFQPSSIPFKSISYETSPNLDGYSIVEGTAADIGGLYAFLQSLPAPTPQQTFADAAIELAPGKFYSQVLVPTLDERSGDFRDINITVVDPMAGGQAFVENIIPFSRFGDPFVFVLGPGSVLVSTSAPEPSLGWVVGMGIFAVAIRTKVFADLTTDGNKAS